MEDGNTFVNKQQYNEAVHRYTYALKRIPSEKTDKHEKVFTHIKAHLLLKLSRCKRKQRAFQEAIQLASEVINMNIFSFEAYHARSKVQYDRGNIKEALADLNEAVTRAPSNMELLKEMVKLRRELGLNNQEKETVLNIKPESHEISASFNIVSMKPTHL